MIILRRTVLAASLLISSAAFAQAPAEAAPSAAAPQVVAPAPAAAAPAALADPLPKADPKFFTAPSPSVETVTSFLTALWGYDPERLFRVMAIQKTAAPGVAKVVIFVTDHSANAKIASTAFYVTPDGKHAIGEGAGVIPFGAQPFADIRAMLLARADGAFRGATSKDLEIVEFADLQCPHCKEAQSTMDQIAKDFPNAHIVFQPFPLVDIHASAFKAAAYGVCVEKQSNEAFFKYASGVFDTQNALAPGSDDTVLQAAVTRAGLDAAAIAKCADTPATKAIVDADIKLADDVGVEQTPLLAINGRLVPPDGIPYEQLKAIIVFQAKLDGVSTGAAADILTPKPPAPVLNNVPN